MPHPAKTCWRLRIDGTISGGNACVCEMEFRASIGGADETNSTDWGSRAFGSPVMSILAFAFDNNAGNYIQAADATMPFYVGWEFPSALSIQEVLVNVAILSDTNRPSALAVEYADSQSGPWTVAATITTGSQVWIDNSGVLVWDINPAAPPPAPKTGVIAAVNSLALSSGAVLSSMVLLMPGPYNLASALMLSAGPASASFPVGIGSSAFVAAVMQHGLGYSSGLSGCLGMGGGGVPCSLAVPLRIAGGGDRNSSALLGVGAGGASSTLAAPLRIAGGGDKSAALPVSIDGAQYSAALSQAAPMSAMSGTKTVSAPLSLSNPSVLIAPYDVAIIVDGRDITREISECVIISSESALFDTITVGMPNGSAWPLDAPPAEITVTLPGMIHRFLVEEFTGDGAARSIWGRTEASLYAEPWSASGVWNERNSNAVTAAELAYDLAGSSWELNDFPLPPRWEVSGTPADALSTLAKAAGGIVMGDDDTISVRRRWPVRPVDMSTAALTISRETALELTISHDDTPSYGGVIVHGWSPDAILPRFEVEGTPQLGQSAFVRLYWQGEDHPSAENWITSGSAQKQGKIAETVTETIVFNDGAASVSYPVWELLEFSWLGRDYGDIIWLENGYSTELELSTPGHGVAQVTYRTEYERWRLSEQAAETVLFGIDVSQGAISADVRLASGGAAAGEVKEPLLGSIAACVSHGAALLDDSRIRYTVKATLPRTAHISTGTTAWVEDELTGLSGFGKTTSVETRITPARITQSLEVAVC